MKKLFPVLLLAMIIGLFSSCIIVTNPDGENYYNITCHNQSNTYIQDWCVVRNGKKTYAKSSGCAKIAPNTGTATLYNLPEGRYILYVAFTTNPSYEEGDYIETREFILNKDYDVYIDQTYVPNLQNN